MSGAGEVILRANAQSDERFRAAPAAFRPSARIPPGEAAYARCVPEPAVVDVAFEERYWYPDDGGVVWLAGYAIVDAGAPRAAVVLREQRPSPREPRTGLTMLLAPAPAIELRERPRA